jgi:hypothetical protein
MIFIIVWTVSALPTPKRIYLGVQFAELELLPLRSQILYQYKVPSKENLDG